jgi:anti-sigma-K factor RsiG
MTEFMAGGRRRIDRVLDPDFLDGIRELPIEELRRRRAEADQEGVDLSYARRLLQGRIDILRAEQQRRHGAGPLAAMPRSDAAIVAALGRILADPPSDGRPVTQGRHALAMPTRVGEHRREAERAVADVGGSDLDALADADLDAAIDRLAAIEARVSRSRRSVHAVVDTLTDEVARRYTADHTLLAHSLP